MRRTATAANAIFVYKHERNVCKGRPSSALNCLNKYIIKHVFVHGLYDIIPVCVISLWCMQSVNDLHILESYLS